MSLSLLFHIALVAAAIGFLGFLGWLTLWLIERPDNHAGHADGSHRWPTPRFLWRTFHIDWDDTTRAVRAHLAPGLSIEVLPCEQLGSYSCCDDVPLDVPHSHAHRGGCASPDCHGCAPRPDGTPAYNDLVAALEPLPPMNLPGWDTQESDGLGDHPAGEPTPNQRQALWQPHVIPSRVIAALENASPEDTATSPATLPQWVRDFLTVPLASLDLLERTDKIGLAVRQA